MSLRCLLASQYNGDEGNLMMLEASASSVFRKKEHSTKEIVWDNIRHQSNSQDISSRVWRPKQVFKAKMGSSPDPN